MNQKHALQNALLTSGPIFLSALIGLCAFVATKFPFLYFGALLGLGALGFALFFSAKLSLLRQGYLISFGPRRLSPAYRRLYLVGYGLMGSSVLLGLQLLLPPSAT